MTQEQDTVSRRFPWPLTRTLNNLIDGGQSPVPSGGAPRRWGGVKGRALGPTSYCRHDHKWTVQAPDPLKVG